MLNLRCRTVLSSVLLALNISGKIHEALKAWFGMRDTSTLNQNIPGSNPNLGSTSQPSRTLCYFLVWWN